MRIGFVDHHLNNFHATKFLSLLHGPLADRGARVVAAWESDPTGEDWCAAKGVERCGSAEEVAERADALIVLAPDNIEAHLDLCRRVFPAGKRVMVDKFLAPSSEEARQILDLAQQHGVAVFSSSALRFAVEVESVLEGAPRVEEAFARGMGEWGGYGVHTLAMVLAAMGAEVARLIDTGTETASSVTLEYRDGRRASVEVRAAENMWDVLPWSFGYRVGKQYRTGTISDFDGFYANLMRQAVEFFRTGVSPVSEAEMPTVVRVLEAAGQSRAAGGEWVSL